MDFTHMFADPFSVRLTTNLSISDANLQRSQDIFFKALNETTNILQADPDLSEYPLFWDGVYRFLQLELSEDLLLEYPKINSCEDEDRCFAVQKTTGDCVCRLASS